MGGTTAVWRYRLVPVPVRLRGRPPAFDGSSRGPEQRRLGPADGKLARETA